MGVPSNRYALATVLSKKKQLNGMDGSISKLYHISRCFNTKPAIVTVATKFWKTHLPEMTAERSRQNYYNGWVLIFKKKKRTTGKQWGKKNHAFGFNEDVFWKKGMAKSRGGKWNDWSAKNKVQWNGLWILKKRKQKLSDWFVLKIGQVIWSIRVESVMMYLFDIPFWCGLK